MFTVGKEQIPIFAVAGPLWEILHDDKRLCIIRGDQKTAQDTVDFLNALSGDNHGDHPQDPGLSGTVTGRVPR
jgi:hypothetical protein